MNKEHDLLKRAYAALLEAIESIEYSCDVNGYPHDNLIKEIKSHVDLMEAGAATNISTKYHSRCLEKAASDEPIFVLRANDPTSPVVVRHWCDINWQLQPADKIGEAGRLAETMDCWREANSKEVTVLAGGIEATSVHDRAMLFYNYKVTHFRQVNDPLNVLVPVSKGSKKRIRLNLVFLGVHGQGELTDANIKSFCDFINDCAQAGDIEYGSLSQMAVMKRCDVKEPVPMEQDASYLMSAHMIGVHAKAVVKYFAPTYEQQRWMLLYYPMSRLTTEQLKAKYGNRFLGIGETVSVTV